MKSILSTLILFVSCGPWLTVTGQTGDSLRILTLEEVTIQSKSILNKTSTDANRMPLDYLESPQVYNSVSHVVLEKQIATNVEDAMRNIVGVTKLWDATGRADGGSFFTSRGFYTSTKARNGIANIATTNIDMANIERMEVIKGPSATLFGSIVPSYGGVINRITKQPFMANRTTVDLATGTQGFYRVSADANFVLNKQRSWAARLNVAGQDQDTWQDQGGQKSYLLAPVVTFQPNDRLKATFEAEILGTKGTSNGGSYVFFLTPTSVNQSIAAALLSQGMPQQTVDALMTAAPKTFREAYGTDNIKELQLDYNRSYLNNELKFTSATTSFFSDLRYRFSDHWTSQTTVTYSRTTNKGYMGYQYLLPNYLLNFIESLSSGTPSFGTPGHDYLARMVWSPGGHTSNVEIQQNFISDYRFTNGMRNRAVAGLDFSNFQSDIRYNRFYGSLRGLPFHDVFDVVPSRGEVPGYDDFNLNAVKQAYAQNESASLDYIYNDRIYSAFVNDIFNVSEHIILNAGLRLDHFSRKGSYEQTTLSPKFGLIVSPWKQVLSLFANYQNGFTNKNGVDARGKGFKPEEADQWEAGLKYHFVEGKVTGSISYYNIAVKNIVRADINNPMLNVQDGELHSKGLEFEILANPLRGWNLIAGYAYNQSKYAKADADVQGRRPEASGPPNAFNFWTNYTFTSTLLKGLGLGAGVNYAGEAASVSLNSVGSMTIPAYTLVSTHVTYDQSRWKAGIRINNLADQRYWMGWTNMIPQRPRQVTLTLGVKL